MPTPQTTAEIAKAHSYLTVALDATSKHNDTLRDALLRGFAEDAPPPPNVNDDTKGEPEIPDDDPPPVGWEEVQAPVAFANSNVSPDVMAAPASLSGRNYLGYQGTDPAEKWRRTLWLFRLYNAVGMIENIKARGIGDFIDGREGHVVYANIYDDFTVGPIDAEDIGAQVLQLVWRGTAPSIIERETRLPGWDSSEGVKAKAGATLYLPDIRARRTGLINTGEAVRASWPISIFNPGHNVEADYISLDNTENPEFIGDRGETFASKGGISQMPGKDPTTRGGTSVWDEVVIRTRLQDRASLRWWAQDSVEVKRGLIESVEGRAYVDIVDDCDSVVLHPDLTGDFDIRICKAAEPYKPVKVIPYTGGGFSFPQDA